MGCRLPSVHEAAASHPSTNPTGASGGVVRRSRYVAPTTPNRDPLRCRDAPLSSQGQFRTIDYVSSRVHGNMRVDAVTTASMSDVDCCDLMGRTASIRIVQVSIGKGIPCPDCLYSLGTISEVAARFFETGLFPCGHCGSNVDVWDASHKLVQKLGASFNGLTSLGAQETTFTMKLSRNEIRAVDISQFGVPEDATLLQVSFHAQRHDCCQPLVTQGQFFPQTLVRKVLVFGQPVEGDAQEEVVAACVTWVPSHDDYKESWIYLAEAFDAWASQRFWHVILPAYVAFEIALMRVVRAAMKRRLPKNAIADFSRNGLTSSVAMNVILPLLCDSSNVKHLPDPIRGELNRLRRLRNDLVHDGLRKDAVPKLLASEMLCATVFGFEYLRYAESCLVSQLRPSIPAP
jgi:hypothetical protein